MPPVRDNSRLYPDTPFERYQDRIRSEVFIVEVLSVDFERRCLTVQDIKENLIYPDVTIFPASISSYETIGIDMPEAGAMGVAQNYDYEGSHRRLVITAWVNFQLYAGIDTIASRPLSGDQIQGFSNRVRPSYRKAWPGQKTSVYTGGFSEKIDTAWDRQAADLTRDKQDPNKRQWTQIAGRRVGYSDAGVQYTGSINRPTATTLK